MPREVAKHLDAFDKYYNMGEKRSLKLLAGHCNVTEKTCKVWSGNFNWQERIRQRDLENSKAIEKRVNEQIVDARTAELLKIREKRKQLSLERSYLIALYGKTKDKIEAGKLGIDTVRDMNDTVKAMLLSDKVDMEYMKAEMSLQGVSIDKVEHTGEELVVRIIGAKLDEYPSAKEED